MRYVTLNLVLSIFLLQIATLPHLCARLYRSEAKSRHQRDLEVHSRDRTIGIFLLIQRINTLQEVLEGKELSPHKFNQAVRGHNYFWVDFIMTTKLLDLEAFTQVMRYFKMNIDFLVQYLAKVQ